MGAICIWIDGYQPPDAGYRLNNGHFCFTGDSMRILTRWGRVAVAVLFAASAHAQTTVSTPQQQSVSYGGKTYKTVVIGGKRWMAENLNYQTSSGSWCYDNDNSNCDKYGRLYDWETAMTVCPAGFHLPSRQEWNNLVAAAGGDRKAGKKLKAKSSWNKKGNGMDDYGFSALPGGRRYSDGSFNYAGNLGFWWTATEYDSGSAYLRGMGYDGDYVGKDDFDKSIGYSVRCVED